MIALILLLAPQDLSVDIDFPGGSAEVVEMDPEARRLRIRPSDRPGRGWRCWWYFRLGGCKPGEAVTLEVEGGGFALPDRAHFSLDGKTWRHTEPGKRTKGRVTYAQKVDRETVWFSWGPPFVLADARSLVERIAASPHAEAFTLCESRDGHAVPAVRVGKGPRRIWVEARQHAWESGSSWVCRGFVEWLVSDAPEAAALRDRAVVTVVPIMDVDNVQRGAGGKQQKPHDHNRDWSARPHHPEVAAATRLILDMDAEKRFDLFIDLHNPGPGARDARPYYYLPPPGILSKKGRANFDRFIELSRQRITGPLKLAEKMRESGASYDPMWRRISKNWIAWNTHDHVVGVTLETSWNTPVSTSDNYRTVGRQLGEAVSDYLK